MTENAHSFGCPSEIDYWRDDPFANIHTTRHRAFHGYIDQIDVFILLIQGTIVLNA